MISIMLHVCAINWHNTICSVLSGLFWGVLHPPISVSVAAAPPIRVMACKADLYSKLLPNSYTHASTQQLIAQ